MEAICGNDKYTFGYAYYFLGSWKNRTSGDVVIEETVVISIIDFDGTAGAKLGAFIDGIKRDYNQESVAVVTDKIESELK